MLGFVLVFFGPGGLGARAAASSQTESLESDLWSVPLGDDLEDRSVPPDAQTGAANVGPARALAEKSLAVIESDYAGRVGIIAVLDDGSGFSVPIVSLSPSEAADIEARAPKGLRFVADVADVSLEDLYSLRDAVYADLEPRSTWGVMVGIDADTATVEVGIPRQEPERDELANRAGVIATAFEQERVGSEAQRRGLLSVIDAEQIPTDGRGNAPARGGRWVNFPANPSSGACTIGFVVTNSSGAFRALSAGHCAAIGNLAEAPSGTNFGNVVHDQSPVSGAKTADSLAFALPTNYDGRGVVTVTSGGSYKQVVGQRNYSQQYSNDSFCFTGRGLVANTSDDQRCGPIKKLGVMWHGAAENCIERRNYSGDSGGPMYALDSSGRAIAGGTITHGITESHPIWSDSHYTCFVPIDTALDGLYSLVVEK